MDVPLFLQIFLLIDIFIMGILVPIAVRHAIAHFKHQPKEVEKNRVQAPAVHLPADVKEHLLQTAQTNFQKILDHSALELQTDLASTTIQLNKKLEKVGSEIVEEEMKRYRADLEQLRKQVASNMANAQTDIETHQTDLKSKLSERQTELEAELVEKMKDEHQRLLQDIDTKLADAVASFLTETLQHNIDIGSQSAYLTAMLEEHKDDFKNGISDET